MKKSSRIFTARVNRTSFDPSTTARARADLRSTKREFDITTPERPADERGLTDDEVGDE